MSAKSKFRRGIAKIMGQVAAGHQLAISACYMEGQGPRVMMSAGNTGLAMGMKEARHIAEIYSSPEAVAHGLNVIADDLLEAVAYCETRTPEQLQEAALIVQPAAGNS
jgi:hypothetical protein